MVELGLGKNMVRSLRFWAEVTRVATACKAGHELTPFARAVLVPGGFDEFLEDIRSLWILHWHIASRPHDPVFAWDFLLNRWQHPEISRSEVLEAFQRETARLARPLSAVTLVQHIDIFLHSYIPTRGRSGSADEDALDCPLVDLELLVPSGERRTRDGRRETVYTFRRESKPEISAGVFAYCLDDFWRLRRTQEQTLPFRDVAVAEGSVGQIFKLPEDDLRTRLEGLENTTAGYMQFRTSAAQPMLVRSSHVKRDMLRAVYTSGGTA